MSYKKIQCKTPVGIARLFSDLGQTKEWMTNYVGAYFDLSENKGCEINLYFALRPSINLSTGFLTKCDHAGFEFTLDLFGLELEIKIYDGRHWNTKANRYYLPGEEQAEREKNGPDIELGDVGLDD